MRAIPFSARQRGMSVTQSAVALAVGAAAMAVAGWYLLYGNTSGKVKATASDLIAVRQVVRSMYQGQADFTGLSTNLVASSGQLPSRLVSGSGARATLRNAFDGAMGLSPSYHKQNYAITLGSIPKAACEALATMDMGQGFLAISVGGGPKPASAAGRPLTAEEAAGACGNASGASVITVGDTEFTSSVITWQFN